PGKKLMYGAGDIGFSLTSTILGVYFLFFMIEVVGLRPGIAAIPIGIGKVWDFVNDPIFGYISDRTRTRWGRRRPYLLFGALPLALTFTMLWYRPGFESTAALVAYYSIAYIIFEASATLLYMPYFALTPELTSDYDERTSLTSYRMFFSILGSLLAFTVPLMIVGSFTPENAPKVLLMGAIFGLISALPMFITFFGTKEREDLVDLEKPTLLESIQSVWKNVPFRYGLGIFLATWISVDILQSSLLFYVRFVVQRESHNDIIMATIFVVAMFALPIWTWVSKKWSKRYAYIFGIAFWAVVQMVLIMMGPSTPLSVILILCSMAGIGVAAAHVLPWAILPDAIEWYEYQTGERHEGMFYSITTLARKVTSAVSVTFIGPILEMTGYQPHVTQQSAEAVRGIKWVIGPLPAILLGLGILIAFKYPLDREQFQAIVSKLKTDRSNSDQ
ncbi:MAG: glycoside-pentoside-hexuronide (GPH):cation symporter, partial [Anaerolineales bacterium]|nr:glycoside-pentoside-hexuronide (GPH):cation symporter [Anaerolineales bacterium]